MNSFLSISLGILITATVLGLILWRIRWLADFDRCIEMVFLKLSFPRNDSKEDREKSGESIGTTMTFKEVLDVGTHFFDAIYSIYDEEISNQFFIGQPFFSCEMVVLEKQLQYYFVVPREKKDILEKQISAFYSDTIVEQVEDYNLFPEGNYIDATMYTFSKKGMFPIKTFKHMGWDPMNTTINVMSKLDDNETAAVQIMLRPMNTGWQDKGRKYAEDMSAGGHVSFWSYFNPIKFTKFILQSFFSEKAVDDNTPQSKNSQLVEERLKIMEEKNTKNGYQSVIRVISTSPDKDKVEKNQQSLRSAFAQYDNVDGNIFERTIYFKSKRKIIREFILRSMKMEWWYWITRHKTILTGEELSSLFHLPNIKYNKSPVIQWQDFKLAPPPNNLPKEGIILGTNFFRGKEEEVRIMRDDRRRHFYLIGKSGTGKSTLLETMIKQDLKNGDGLCVVDPHGDLVETMLKYIPRERADDVIYFNPGDMERPMGLNILEAYTDDQKEFMSQEALAIFIKMFGEEIMGPRLQHYFRNGCLTLMADDEDGATLLDIPRLFTDDAFAEYKQKKVKNPAVRQFWDKEMANTGQREKQEMIPYFSSKFGPFVTNVQIRNIIGQTKSGFNFREVMDNRKILLVNLSKGKLGDLNAKLLGMIMVAKIQMSAMSRVDTPEKERKDFYLYVDEFQNFVTDSFASILSEARKYRLNLIIAHQYISQITKMDGGGKGRQEDTTIRDAVFGNVGSMLSFKIGSTDGEIMAKEFAPVFTEQDLINIANYQAYIKLNINNTTSRPFTIKTIYDPSGADKEAANAFVQLSRLKWARDAKFVNKEIARRLS